MFDTSNIHTYSVLQSLATLHGKPCKRPLVTVSYSSLNRSHLINLPSPDFEKCVHFVVLLSGLVANGNRLILLLWHYLLHHLIGWNMGSELHHSLGQPGLMKTKVKVITGINVGTGSNAHWAMYYTTLISLILILFILYLPIMNAWKETE